jgi:SAM-dependent methyltransferase
MHDRTAALVAEMDRASMSAAEISGGFWKDRGWKSFTELHYPDFDICKDVRGAYDIIFAEQVFEHLIDPERALMNVRAMLHPGGRFLITTPFLIRIHHSPIDVHRWTPKGMELFLRRCAFTNISVESWGNRACVIANLDKWVHYDPAQHSLENEPAYPVVVWALATK